MISKRDNDGNVTYSKLVSGLNAGVEIWFEYDEDGNCIYERNSQGYEAHWGYEDGYLASYTNSNGIERRWDVKSILNNNKQNNDEK